MARKLPLKTLAVENPINGLAQQFVYADTMMQILRLSSAGRGLSIDEVEQVMDAVNPIKQAKEVGEPDVTLTETQYKTLRDRLEQFQFGFAADEIVDFIRAVRQAPELGTEVDRPRRVS